LLAGGDENSPKDVGAFINNIARIQDTTGAHLLLVHHVPHDQNRMRGHGALLAACDTTIRVEKNGSIRTATIEKNNDGEEGEQIAFSLENFELGKDPETGDMTTAPIVRPAEAPCPSAVTTGPRLTPNRRTMFTILHHPGERGMSIEEWNERAREAGIGTTRKADLYDIRTALKSKGLVRQYADRWNTC
jgi:hypothetical protein